MTTEVSATTRYGHTILVDPSDLIGRHILKKGIFDLAGIEGMRAILKSLKDPIVFDIGANIGNHSLAFAPLCRALYAFEPQPEVFDRLTRNFQINKFTHCKAFPYGISNVTASLEFFQNQTGNHGGSSFVERPGHHCTKLTLEVKNGDSVARELASSGVDFIKIDVEGLEAEVISGLTETIDKHQPIIVVEWVLEKVRQDFECLEIFKTALKNYNAIAIVSKTDKHYWYSKRFGRIRRLIRKFTPYKQPMFVEFIPSNNYDNVVLYPQSKQHIINSLV
jgi:FkbM family methyltransferase